MGQNLICIYGATGSGKTRHLRIMEDILMRSGVMYIGVEEMISILIESVSNATVNTFRQKYLAVETLLIDNLWVLNGRPATAELLCQLISQRNINGKLTVIASETTRDEWLDRSDQITQLLSCGVNINL